MAWISVHDHVIGGKLREFSKVLGCSQKESLGILVSLWIWGINNADKTGKLKSCDRNDVAEVLSIGLSENLNPREIVAGLIKQRWIDEEEDGTLYLHDWDVWQEQWYKFLSNKEYDAKRKKAARDRQKAQTEQKTDQPKSEKDTNNPTEVPADTPSDSPPDSPPDIQSSKKVRSNSKVFEEFWAVYPKKVGKSEAYKKYKARLNDGFSEDELMEAAHNYAEECLRKNTEDTYIKHAKTFLSENTPFTDYLPKKSVNQDECEPKKVQNMQSGIAKGNRFHNFEQRNIDYDSMVINQVQEWINSEQEE